MISKKKIKCELMSHVLIYMTFIHTFKKRSTKRHMELVNRERERKKNTEKKNIRTSKFLNKMSGQEN